MRCEDLGSHNQLICKACMLKGQIKKISVFRVMGIKILGRLGTHIFFLIICLSGKKNNFMHFERPRSPYQFPSDLGGVTIRIHQDRKIHLEDHQLVSRGLSSDDKR